MSDQTSPLSSKHGPATFSCTMLENPGSEGRLPSYPSASQAVSYGMNVQSLEEDREAQNRTFNKEDGRWPRWHHGRHAYSPESLATFLRDFNADPSGCSLYAPVVGQTNDALLWNPPCDSSSPALDTTPPLPQAEVVHPSRLTLEQRSFFQPAIGTEPMCPRPTQHPQPSSADLAYTGAANASPFPSFPPPPLMLLAPLPSNAFKGQVWEASGKFSTIQPQPQVWDNNPDGVSPRFPPIPDCLAQICFQQTALEPGPSQTPSDYQRTSKRAARVKRGRTVAEETAVMKRRKSKKTGEHCCPYPECTMLSGEPADFSTKKSLSYHMKHQHGAKTYACGSCAHTSVHKNAINRHYKALHPGVKVKAFLIQRVTASAVDRAAM